MNVPAKTTTQPNQSLIDAGEPTILLDGQAWPVPKLAFKQNKIVVPAIMRVMPVISSSVLVVSTPQEDGSTKTERRFDMKKLSEAMNEKLMDDLALIVFTALLRAHPTLSRAEFDDMVIGTMDMITSVMVVGYQTGIMKPRSKEDGPVVEAGKE